MLHKFLRGRDFVIGDHADVLAPGGGHRAAAAVYACRRKIKGVDFRVAFQKLPCLIVAFKIVVAVFDRIHDADARIAFADPVAEALDAVRMAEHLGGSGDDAGAHLSVCDQPHQPCGGLPAPVKIASHKGETEGIVDVGICRDDGDPFLGKPVDTFRDGSVVKGADHKAVDALLFQLVHGGKLFCGGKADAFFEDGAVVARQLLFLFQNALPDVFKKRVFGIKKQDAELNVFALGGEGDPGGVGLVVQTRRDVAHERRSGGIDGTAVV